MRVRLGDLEIGTHRAKRNLLRSIHVYMAKWTCSSCDSRNSENLLNCLSDFILNISILSTVSPCTVSLELEFGRLSFFFIIYTNGSLFKGTLLLHGNTHLPFLSLTLRSRERYVFTTRQFNHFFLSLTSYISSRAKSAEKTKSYKQTSTSSSCLRNSCWQHTFHIPEVGCSERDRQTPGP